MDAGGPQPDGATAGVHWRAALALVLGAIAIAVAGLRILSFLAIAAGGMGVVIGLSARRRSRKGAGAPKLAVGALLASAVGLALGLGFSARQLARLTPNENVKAPAEIARDFEAASGDLQQRAAEAQRRLDAERPHPESGPPSP